MKFRIFTFLLLFLAFKTQASHLRAGEVTAKRINCLSLTFEITVTVYLDTKSGIRFGGDDDSWLDFGDGTRILIEETRTTPRPDLGTDMGMASYKTTHTYNGNGTYIISYSERVRNADILNMDASDKTLFYVETAVYIDPFMSCNPSLPLLSVPPVDKACSGVAYFHDPGAYELDGDSLSFELAVSQQAKQTPVTNYKALNDPKFYLNFNTGNEEQNGIPTLSIHPENGTLKWDAPGAAGEYNIAFRIIEWRRNPAGRWQKISYVTRDMQIVVEDCDNKRPDLIIPNDTCVVAGTRLDATIFGIDPENHPVKIEVFSELFQLSFAPATVQPHPAVFQPSAPPAQLRFSWNTQCNHIKEQFYRVVFKITDNPPRGPKLVTFQTWRIKVVGPPPEWNDLSVDIANRNAALAWDQYECSNASTMQIWRKVDGADYQPGVCETGMPAFLGYSLVATVALKDPLSNEVVKQYLDTNGGKGLAVGAKYCYRLVAVFPSPKGGESYVSRDTCLVPIRADAPVITHVTVEKTDSQMGAVRISWRSPFEIDRTQFPGPYEYEIYRGDGFEGPALTRITPDARIRDTTFVDAGIDTQTKTFNYTIVLYSNTATNITSWSPVDTSATASSVWLKGESLTDAIALNWSAMVPWSNHSSQYPYHLIYRGEEGVAETEMLLIDSINVIQHGFAFNDKGLFQNTPLDQNKVYCYRIMTRGVYGNPQIKQPLQNFSQLICIRPNDTTPPCQPSLTLTGTDCNTIFQTMGCSVDNFRNTLSWNRPADISCANDIISYNIYFAENMNQEFSLLAGQVTDSFYLDTSLRSFARCYRIAAVDRSGNESEWSDIVCNDNCPYFELPNVFTPNGDGCNEKLSAYGPFNPLLFETSPDCPVIEDYTKCIRFVEEVHFKVFNRWGMEIYSSESHSGDHSIYVNWDGKDNSGVQLASGVYYYQAKVMFDTIDPRQKQKTYKGWVHLVR